MYINTPMIGKYTNMKFVYNLENNHELREHYINLIFSQLLMKFINQLIIKKD